MDTQRRQFESQLEAAAAERLRVEGALREREELLARAQQAALVGAEDGQVRDRWCEAARDLVVRLAKKASQAERTRIAQDIAQKKGSIGTFGVQRMGTRVFDTWMDGFDFTVKRQRLKELEMEKAELEQQRKDLKKNPKATLTDDVLKGKIENLKKEEKKLTEAMEDLEAEKKAFIREMKRYNDESESEYQGCHRLSE